MTRPKLPTDQVPMNIPTIRSERTAFKHACERQNVTMQDQVNLMCANYVVHERTLTREQAHIEYANIPPIVPDPPGA